MSLLTSFRSEILKTKRTAAFYLTIIAAIFGPFMSSLDAMFGEGISAESGKVIFNQMMTNKFEMTALVMLPIFVVLIATLLPQIEYKNNAWKQVLASPQPKVNVFLAKLVNMHLLILVFLVTNLLAMFLTVVVLHFREPSLHVLNQSVSGYNILLIRVNIYVALLAMSSVQFWLGLRFKNFIVPIAIGISCWIIGTILVLEFKSSLAEYFPYSFHVYSTFPNYKPQLNAVHWTSLAFAVAILVLAFMNFARRGSKS
jgi:hypothetical protein